MSEKSSPLTFSSEVLGSLNPEKTKVDATEELFSLRPKALSEYIGQRETIETLGIAIAAAKKRGEPLEHVLFHGPPGLGKTTLAHIIASEMGGNLTITSGPTLERPGDLVGILTHLSEGDVLFIDEIHRLPRTVEEFLYSAMEDFAIDFVFDKGMHARSHRFRLGKFVLVGATTRVGLLSAPLRDRFGLFRSLDFYDEKDLMRIARRSAALLGIEMEEAGAKALAGRSRGTPRIVNRLLKRVRDYADIRGDGRIDEKIVHAALHLEGIDDKGLTPLDRRYLKTIFEFYGGGPVGIEAIAATLQEESDTLVDVVEPYLLKNGFVIRTSSGRRLGASAYSHLGFPLRGERPLFDEDQGV